MHQDLEKQEEDLTQELGNYFNRKKLKVQEHISQDHPSVIELDQEVKILTDLIFNKKIC